MSFNKIRRKEKKYIYTTFFYIYPDTISSALNFFLQSQAIIWCEANRSEKITCYTHRSQEEEGSPSHSGSHGEAPGSITRQKE